MITKFEIGKTYYFRAPSWGYLFYKVVNIIVNNGIEITGTIIIFESIFKKDEDLVQNDSKWYKRSNLFQYNINNPLYKILKQYSIEMTELDFFTKITDKDVSF